MHKLRKKKKLINTKNGNVTFLLAKISLSIGRHVVLID